MNNDDIEKNSDLHDPELHDKAITALYRQLPDEVPAPDTDALIQAAARRAVGAAPQKKLSTSRLQGLLASAATLALGIALVVQWRSEPQQLQELLATAPQAAAPAADMADKNAASPAVVKSEAAAKPLPAKKQVTRNNAVASNKLGATGHDSAEALFEEDAAPPSPSEMKAAEPENRTREMADMMMKKSAEEDRRQAAQLAGTAQRSEALRSGVRPDAYSPAPAAVAPASISALPEIEAGVVAEKAKSESTLPPYQQAMQAGLWAEAEKLLAAAPVPKASPQSVDLALLARVQNKDKQRDCAALPEKSGDALLCRFITLRSEGKDLPADALAQLEKSGALSGSSAYRRTAIIMLLEKP